ncbi:alpha/beta hydrolase [Geobacter sp.]|uniref:esterase/lipase family protein n=1 Tax=Geobacter sp. TaxID=46610 RepID=UPI00262B4AB9|nr:alpha/beta hydrolase [Geobacter sp.]
MANAPKFKEVVCSELSKSVEGFETESQNRLVIDREVLPIIFVPGIMGSRLGRSQNDKVWDPDSTWFMFTTYGRRKTNAEWKKELLIGSEFKSDHLQVLNDDAEHNAKFADETDTSRAQRGWGGVSWSSYGSILKELQNGEWDPTVNLFFEIPVHAFGYNWTASNDLAGEKLASYIDEVRKQYTDKGRKCEKVLLVTHSMGGLVARAACLLHGARDKVLGVIHGVQPANGSPAAYWRMKGGFERPHTIPDIEFSQWFRNPVKMFNHLKGTVVNSEFLGIPLTNLKIGKGHVTAWVLGTDGEEVTALLGNMPGGLQLLPNKQYKNNNGWERWLELLDVQGNRTALPVADPYKEIYRVKTSYFRLVNPDWLNPGKTESAEDFERDDWKLYIKYLAEAEKFHDSLHKLGEKAHPETYQFYSSGIASADRVIFKSAEDTLWEKVKRLFNTVKDDVPKDLKGTAKTLVFKTVKGGGNPLVPVLIDMAVALAGGALVKDTDWYANRGGYRDRIDAAGQPSAEGELQLVTMQLPDGAGDGTVPESSARALTLKEDTKRTFCIGDKKGFEAGFAEKKAPRTKPKVPPDFDEGFFDRGHEPIYQTESAKFITCTAIENICRKQIRQMLQQK